MEKHKEILDKFNEMINDGKHTRDEAYLYLMEQKNKMENDFYKKYGFHMDMGYAFLYPETMTSYVSEKK